LIDPSPALHRPWPMVGFEVGKSIGIGVEFRRISSTVDCGLK
jgi:hypothetical protein